jgi:hypothetical protein
LRQALAPLVHKTYSVCKDRERMRQRVHRQVAELLEARFPETQEAGALLEELA